MSELKICRICLRTKVKVYKYDQFYLKTCYEEVLGMKVDMKDSLPHYFCYECSTMLYKFHKFKEKCHGGLQTLKQILYKGNITYDAVYNAKRKSSLLKSPLDVIAINKRVKTIVVKNYENTKRRTRSSNSKTDKDYTDTETDKSASESDSDMNAEDPIHEEEIFLKELIKEPDKEIVDKELVELDKPPDIVELPNSPIQSDSPPLFVDVKKELVKLKNEKRPKLPKSKKFQSTTKKMILDENNWKTKTLSEEDAVKDFRARADDPKYLVATYKCTDCYKWFSKEEILDRHKKLRHNESLKQDCRFCHMRFNWDCKLRKHMRQHFSRFICLRCGLVCNLEHSALLHEDYHNGVTQKCVHCGEEFRHLSTYYTHMRTHRSEYICTLCGASFVSELGLHQHKKVKHVEDVNNIESPDDDEEVNTFCETCNMRFETRKAFEEHLFHSANHTEAVESSILEDAYKDRKVLGKKLKAVVTSELRRRRRPELGEPTSSYKGTIAKRKERFTRKVRKPTTCHQCGKHFDTQAACMKHHLAEHPRTSFFPASERHICEICGVSLAPGSVPTHRNMHSRETLHTCGTCGREFHSSVGLKRHMVTHTGEKPFACNLCDKRFTQSNSMKLHYKTFHLKQPYPKRNRRKKKDDEKSDPNAIDSRSEDSDDSLQEMRSVAEGAAVAGIAADNVHYLTLG